MFILFLALAVLSLIVLIVGFIWLLTSRGRTTRRSGPDVGAEIMTGMGDDDEGDPAGREVGLRRHGGPGDPGR